MNSKQNITIITTILVISISLSAGTAYAEIPSWVKEVAGFWAAGHIDDDEYARTIEYLVTEEIISVPIATANTPTDPTYVLDVEHPCAFLEIWAIKASSDMGLNYITQHIQSVEPSSNVINYYNKVTKGINDSVQTNAEKCTRADYPEHWKRYDHALNAQDKYWEEMNNPTPTKCTPTACTPTKCTPTQCTPNAKTVYTIHEAHQCADLERDIVRLTSLLGIHHEADPEESHELYDYHIRLLKSIRASLVTDSIDCTRADYPESWKRYDYWIDKFNDFIDRVNSPAPTTSAPTTSAPTTSAPTTSAPTTPAFNPNLIEVEILSCERSYEGSDHINFELKFKNLDTRQTYNVEYLSYVTLSSGETVSSGSSVVWDLTHGELKFKSDLVKYPGSWKTCSVKIIGEW